MRTSKIALIALMAGMSIILSAFGQSRDQYGSVLPNHLEGERTVWGSWYAHNPADDGSWVVERPAAAGNAGVAFARGAACPGRRSRQSSPLEVAIWIR
jgi:hypothetical protein